MNVTILHDGAVDIAVGRNRRETNWKNKEMQWSELVQKLSGTHRTAELYREYLSAKKDRQDEIKDIGGFVGGYLSGGRRKAGSIAHRQLITLDIDFAKADIWDDFTMLYGNAAVLYSTHKHCGESPRYRLIVPLDRPVFADEYVAIGRRIAGVIGIDYFDHTTFQPERLMYWPSTAKDGEFEYQYQDGEWMNADAILASYRDWKDSSEWPVSERYNTIIQRSIKKQGDPLEKNGIVGAFCRTYSITEAIETFLADVYSPCDLPDRFTYKEGSTSAGLVVYENKYAYSHHGTDPVSGKLSNAFDLVRLHKFGLRDEDAGSNTPIHKMPSHLAMEEFAMADNKVKKQVGLEKVGEAVDDFAGIDLNEPQPSDPGDESWMEKMDVNRKGDYQNTIKNILLILENDPIFKGKISYDEFAQQAVFIKESIAWRKVTHISRFLKDSDDHYIEYHLEHKYGIFTQKLKKALSVFCGKYFFHPIKDYLSSIAWDGVARLDTLLIDYMGAAETDYTRAVTRKMLVAAVARIYEPGIKFDYMLTLVGEQGKRKSTLINKLGGDWFSDNFDLSMLERGKEGKEQVRGVWLLEIGEMVGMSKTDVNKIKTFITCKQDKYRPAYGEHVQTFPRHCVIFGTTNNADFLRDKSGNRRFWPVDILQRKPTKDVFRHLTEAEISLIWAEAMVLYKKGEPLYLSPALEAAANIIQGEHTEMDERAILIYEYLEKPVPETWQEMQMHEKRNFVKGVNELLPVGVVKRDRISAAEIWTELFEGKSKDLNGFNTKFIHQIMENMPGWRRLKSRSTVAKFGKQIMYKKVENDEVFAGTANEK
ncbi:MAG TPA: virulence-associated E family protein [Chitinophagaceae bacterium]|nr:virulence-associated E family protein [Chitinophagaceae bacterium]